MTIKFFGMVCLLVLTAESSGNSSMVISLFAQFFKIKGVPFVTAFTCWTRGMTAEMALIFSDYGMRLAVIQRFSEDEPVELNVTHKMGVLLDTKCYHYKQIIAAASAKDLFDNIHFWLIWDEGTLGGDAQNETEDHTISNVAGGEYAEGCDIGGVWLRLGGVQLRADSEVTWATSLRAAPEEEHLQLVLLDVYGRPGAGAAPLACEPLGWAEPPLFKLRLRTLDIPSRRRKDHGGCVMRSATVIQYAEHFQSMSDIEDRSKVHIDTWSKIHYPIIQYLGQELNFSIEMALTDSFGWQTNGTFDGLVGLVQRKEIDILGTGVFIRADRMYLLDYAADTFSVGAATIFRQPSLSTVSNIFLLPYRRQVWLCTGGIALATAAVLGVLVWSSSRHHAETGIRATWAEVATVMLCVVCQQGYHESPSTLSARTVLFVASLTGFFLFTSYSANIVALLQTPSTSIRSVADLATSPLRVGLQDISYNHVYLEDSTDEDLRKLYDAKVAHQGSSAFYENVSAGVAHVREGMFAFQVDRNLGFTEISRTFAEHEKCGLSRLQMFPLPTLAIAVVKRSPLRETFAVRVRWYREVGLLHRLEKIWVAQPPRCDNKMSGFVSVGLLEFHPALLALQYGAVAAVLILGLELLFYRRHFFIQTRATKKPKKTSQYRLQLLMTNALPGTK